MEMKVFKKEDHAGIMPVGKMCDLTDYEELKNSIDKVKEEVNTIVIDLSRITFIILSPEYSGRRLICSFQR